MKIRLTYHKDPFSFDRGGSGLGTVGCEPIHGVGFGCHWELGVAIVHEGTPAVAKLTASSCRLQSGKPKI